MKECGSDKTFSGWPSSPCCAKSLKMIIQEIELLEEEEFYEDLENDLIDQVLGRNPQEKRYQYCKQPTKICHRNY